MVCIPALGIGYAASGTGIPRPATAGNRHLPPTSGIQPPHVAPSTGIRPRSSRPGIWHPPTSIRVWASICFQGSLLSGLFGFGFRVPVLYSFGLGLQISLLNFWTSGCLFGWTWGASLGFCGFWLAGSLGFPSIWHPFGNNIYIVKCAKCPCTRFCNRAHEGLKASGI